MTDLTRHCERSEAIQGRLSNRRDYGPGLLRCARNDGVNDVWAVELLP
ncbi:hypothetical protein [Methylobacterium haplocladii]|nr:hypothetical protein [Methylobacterium haplocladii]